MLGLIWGTVTLSLVLVENLAFRLCVSSFEEMRLADMRLSLRAKLVLTHTQKIHLVTAPANKPPRASKLTAGANCLFLQTTYFHFVRFTP